MRTPSRKSPSQGTRKLTFALWLGAMGVAAMSAWATPPQASPAPAPAPPQAPAEAAQGATAQPTSTRVALQPPDGKWLKDEEGREYFVRKIAKPEKGGYHMLSETRVTMGSSYSFDIVGQDEQYFYAKVYRPRSGGNKRVKVLPTAAQLTAKEAEYRNATTSSDRLAFEPIGEGLPTAGHWRNGFDLADVNGDGHLDFVHSSARGQLNSHPNIFLGDGKGGFRYWSEAKYPPLRYEYGDIAAADFNRDGKMDLAIAVHLRGLIVLYGDGRGKFTQAPNGPAYEAGDLKLEQINQFASRKVVALDWDGDGAPEFLSLAEGPAGVFLAGTGPTGRLQESYGVGLFQLRSGAWQRLGGKAERNLYGDSLAIGDFNGDGKLDFAAGANPEGVKDLAYLHLPDGSFEPAKSLPVRGDGYSRAVAAADFDGDGRDDVAVGYQSGELGVRRSGVDVMLSTSDGGWKRVGLYVEPGYAGFYSLAAADLDGDGKKDLVAGTGDGRIFVFLGDGKGGFSNEASDELAGARSCTVWDLGTADLDGDGSLDLVASFAGEQCPGKGSIGAWKWAPTRN